MTELEWTVPAVTCQLGQSRRIHDVRPHQALGDRTRPSFSGPSPRASAALGVTRVLDEYEPGTAPPRQRLRAVATLAAAGIQVGVLLAPIVPGLTTDRANLETVVRAAAEHGAAFLGAGVLHLEPGVREHFDGFLRAEAPNLIPLYRRLYPGARAPAGVEQSLGATVAELRARYGLADRPTAPPAVPAPSTAAGECCPAGTQLPLSL